MPFKKILIALDGSEYSQVASGYAFWLAAAEQTELAAQYVVDPRLADLFVAPEFGEELGFSQSIETSEQVIRALKKIGMLILELFSKEAFARGFMTDLHQDVGYVVEEILKRADGYDLLILGHRGRGQRRQPAELMVGSVAERVAGEANQPVLIARQPVDQVERILVAYDGSEAARGALLLGEELAKVTGKELRIIFVAATKAQLTDGKLTLEQAQSYLHGNWSPETFMLSQGQPAKCLLTEAQLAKSLLVVGAYGFRDPRETVLGSTASYLVRRSMTSLLVYR